MPSRTAGLALALTLLISSLGSATASASTLPEDLTAAHYAISVKDLAAATTALTSATAKAETLAEVASAEVLAKVHYYQGLVSHLNGDSAGAMDSWRTALLIDNGHQWDEALVKHDPSQDLFEALRKEVRDRPEVDALVPPLVGQAKLYVDGQRICPGGKVQEGMHLTQVSCPEDRIYGEWVAFPKKKVKWLKLCPNGVDVNAAPVEEAPKEDAFGFGDLMGTEEEGCPPPGEEVVASTVPEETVDTSGGGLPEGEAPLVRRSVSWPMVAAGGGLLVGGSVALAVASSRKQEFLDPNAVAYGSEAEIQAAAKRVNSASWVGTGLTVVGGGLCVAAVIPW